MRIENLQNENRKYAKSIGNFHVLEYVQDASVSPMNAMNEYFMSKMNVRRRQVVIDIDKDHSAVIQAGAMQWMGGNVQAASGVKGIGDFLGKALKGAVTKETAVKPEYVGEGCLVLEPTYKYIILADIGKWGSAGMTIEDGMFLACDAADKYAEDKLIPPGEYEAFVKMNEFSENAIRRFAERIDRDPGIVLGRLQNDQIVPFTNVALSKALKHKYKVITS